jgi:hypothetical protein
MKRASLAIIVFFAICGTAGAADYLRIDQDSVFMGQGADIDFIITRECPEPSPTIKGASNGFILTASGAATWTFNAFTADPTADAWFSDLTGLLFSNMIDGTSPDSFLTGGASINNGIPIITEHPYFTLTLDVGPGLGAICIDSAFILPAGQWLWDQMTCGHGDGRRPDFLDKNLNTGSPFCVDVWDTSTCENPIITVTPVGDEISGSHCAVLNFDFDATPGAGLYITGWMLVSGPGTIAVGTGLYEVGPIAAGTYPVVIEVENNCGKTDDYAFTVISTNVAPSFTITKGDPPAMIEAGEVYGYDFDATDPDFCDELVFTTDGGTPPPTNPPEMNPETGQFLWPTHIADIGMVYTFRIEVSDGQLDKATDLYWLQVEVVPPAICGDVDLSGQVDIDDVVYLINYIFGTGPPPCEPE